MVFEQEKEFLMRSNQLDLAKKVEWTSQEKGDGAGYDIKSFTLGGAERFIEVKTTNGAKRTPFYISDNELTFSREAGHRYCLRRLYDFRKEADSTNSMPLLRTSYFCHLPFIALVSETHNAHKPI